MPACTIDIVLAICFIPAIIGGLRKGLIIQAVSLVAIVIGAILARKLNPTVCAYLSEHLTDATPQVVKVLAFIGVFLASIIVLNLIGRLLKGIFKLANLGWLDRTLGLLFALFETVLVLGLALLLIDSLSLIPRDKISESVLYTPIKDISGYVFPYIKALFAK